MPHSRDHCYRQAEPWQGLKEERGWGQICGLKRGLWLANREWNGTGERLEAGREVGGGYRHPSKTHWQPGRGWWEDGEKWLMGKRLRRWDLQHVEAEWLSGDREGGKGQNAWVSCISSRCTVLCSLKPWGEAGAWGGVGERWAAFWTHLYHLSQVLYPWRELGVQRRTTHILHHGSKYQGTHHKAYSRTLQDQMQFIFLALC